MNKKSINKFAILVILMIIVPEVAGHLLFEKSHPANSSINAAVLFANNLHYSADKRGMCHVVIQNDTSGTDISRATGLEGKYGTFTCV